MNFQTKEYPGAFTEEITPPKNGKVFERTNYDDLNRSHDSAASAAGVRKAKSSGAPGLEIKCLAEVQPKPIEWLWSNWIAIGKVAILAGEGGKGKSTILCDLAACTTRGHRWPDGAEASAPGDVLILTAEDDLEDTLAPRLIAAGADLKRVFNIRSVRNDDRSRRTFNLQTDLARLEAEINARRNVRLVIIDPVSSYLGKVDSHKNAEVRSVLEPLGDLAARTRTAVLANNHFSKGGGSANNRMIGSVAFVNYARAGFIVTPDAENEGRMLLMPSKMNIAPIKYGMAYRIESAVIEIDGVEILTSRIAWESQPVKITADEALAANDSAAENRTGKAEAIELLRDALSGGPRPANEVKQEATSAGITPKVPSDGQEVPRRSADQARHVRRLGLGTAEGALIPRRCPLSGMGTFGPRGHLRAGESGREPMRRRINIYCYALPPTDSWCRTPMKQKTAHAEMRAAGGEVAVAVGVDQALEQLEAWAMLNGRVT